MRYYNVAVGISNWIDSVALPSKTNTQRGSNAYFHYSQNIRS